MSDQLSIRKTSIKNIDEGKWILCDDGVSR